MFYLQTKHDSPFTLKKDEQTRINQNWELFITQRDITENDTLLRYLSHTETEIDVAPDVTYKDLVGSRFTQTANPSPFLVLSAIAFVKTSDGFFLYQQRDSGDWPLSLELPGGFIRASMTQDDTATFIKRRVARDLRLDEADILSSKLVDLFSFPEILEKMLIFQIELTLSSSDLKKQNENIFIIPQDYTVAGHYTHTKIPLHYPSQVIWETYRHTLN